MDKEIFTMMGLESLSSLSSRSNGPLQPATTSRQRRQAEVNIQSQPKNPDTDRKKGFHHWLNLLAKPFSLLVPASRRKPNAKEAHLSDLLQRLNHQVGLGKVSFESFGKTYGLLMGPDIVIIDGEAYQFSKTSVINRKNKYEYFSLKNVETGCTIQFEPRYTDGGTTYLTPEGSQNVPKTAKRTINRGSKVLFNTLVRLRQYKLDELQRELLIKSGQVPAVLIEEQPTC